MTPYSCFMKCYFCLIEPLSAIFSALHDHKLLCLLNSYSLLLLFCLMSPLWTIVIPLRLLMLPHCTLHITYIWIHIVILISSHFCLMSLLWTLIAALLHVYRPSFLLYVTLMSCSKCITSHHIFSLSYPVYTVFLHDVILFLLYVSLMSSYSCLMPAGYWNAVHPLSDLHRCSERLQVTTLSFSSH